MNSPLLPAGEKSFFVHKVFSGMKFTKLEKTLLQKGAATEEQLLEAKKKSLGSKRPVQEELLEMEYITEEALLNAISELSPHIQ